ncbi:P-loop containing nucleoside triphosphate hydrolase protein [Pluteus cervinus]|uniref:P-loop containing nucleoside triphosphate hydrolase protein n=1 Tax=Pluteus cervinus TaxID=181527 RepID=A0ACD3BF58_9AGAR|nr:P-loop containing nucleoside triphosphate hydrolase protein [Pluteus cervinus]
MTRKVTGYAVTLDINGRIIDAGSLSSALVRVPLLKTELEEGLKELDNVSAEDPISSTIKEPSTAGGKLIMAEEVEVGHVGWKTFGLFLRTLGGCFPLLFFVSFIGLDVVSEMALALQTWFLDFWASQYQDHEMADTLHYLSRYGAIFLVCLGLKALGFFVFVTSQMTIHRLLMDAVLYMWGWLDTTPVSRIIARCTQDIGSVDGPLTHQFCALAQVTVSMTINRAAVLLFTPIFIIPASVIGVLGGWLGQIFIAAQLPVKRELSNAKAPVLAHVGAAIAGTVSVRAYGDEERAFYDLNRWITVRIDALGATFSASLLHGSFTVAATWLLTSGSLNMAMAFSGIILVWIRLINLVEVESSSLERISGYLEADQEPRPTSQGVPPAYWPASGELRVENLSARYSLDGPKVLHDVSFTVDSGQHIGAVGRTGSGKSTLALSLLRTIYTEGDVYYDGIKTDTLNLDALRSNITIIPQMPELLSGTLRQNLDPFEQFDDATLNDALRAAGAGGNLSVGQRQVLALARAIVRGSKLLILDEATSAIDFKTDTVIQSTLRNELKDVTLITIAHRLQTIMDADKILVLNAGHIVEFDTPRNLLANEDGIFRKLVNESADKETLYVMAGAN